MRVGKSMVKFENGSEYIGQFINDEMEGNGIFTDNQGNRFMTISKDDTIGNRNHKDADSGIFIKGKLYGKGEIRYK